MPSMGIELAILRSLARRSNETSYAASNPTNALLCKISVIKPLFCTYVSVAITKLFIINLSHIIFDTSTSSTV